MSHLPKYSGNQLVGCQPISGKTMHDYNWARFMIKGIMWIPFTTFNINILWHSTLVGVCGKMNCWYLHSCCRWEYRIPAYFQIPLFFIFSYSAKLSTLSLSYPAFHQRQMQSPHFTFQSQEDNFFPQEHTSCRMFQPFQWSGGRGIFCKEIGKGDKWWTALSIERASKV